MINDDTEFAPDFLQNAVDLMQDRDWIMLLAWCYCRKTACLLRLAQAPEPARRMGENAWHISREKYCIEAYASRIYEICCSALGRQPQGGDEPPPSAGGNQ